MSRDNQATSTADDIMQLIIDEADPKLRAFLMVMNAFKGSLERMQTAVADTSTAVEEHERNFETHLRNFETFMEASNRAVAKNSVWWKVGAWGLGIGQAIVIALLTFAMTELRDLKSVDAALLAKIHIHDTAIAVLQKGERK